MPKLKIPPKKFFLYNDGWFKDVDGYFVTWLLEEKKESQWLAPYIPDENLASVMRTCNKFVGAGMSWDEACLRRNMLYKRYNTFRFVLRLPGAYFDRPINKVTRITDENWEKAFEDNPFAKAYYHEAESEWIKLDKLFYVANENRGIYGKDIELSNQTEKLESEDEEVSSPMPVSARRRIFNEAYETTDQLLSTMHRSQPEPSYVSRSSNSRLSRGKPPTTDDAGNSSCASCSPFWKC